MSIPYLWSLPRILVFAVTSLRDVIYSRGWPDSNSTAACTVLSSQLRPGQVVWPTNFLHYQREIHAYYSQACGDLLPRCITYPEDALDVSKIVTVLMAHDSSVPFAVKSGGHNHNPGFNNVHDGVLISLSRMNTVEPSVDGKSANVGPGARWGQVQSVLDATGVAAVGGRMGDVGVGGSLLGGGLSFLSPKYGLACDNVLTYEIVLPNGTITQASSSKNKDLFFALRGGGGQFGIVTNFHLRTYPLDKVWGGYRVYWKSEQDSLNKAYHSFLEEQSDPGASIILTYEHIFHGIMSFAVVFYFYSSPNPPKGTFGALENLIPLFDNTKTRSYASLLKSNDRIGNTRGGRVAIRLSRIPVMSGQNGLDLINYHTATFNEFARRAPWALGLSLTTAFQSVPRFVSQESVRRGYNALDIDPDLGDHIWYAIILHWCLPFDDERVNRLSREITERLEAHVSAMNEKAAILRQQSAVPQVFLGPMQSPRTRPFPLFMNEATADQPLLQSYGPRSLERLRAVKQDVDVSGAWSRRTVGWRV